MKQLDITTLLKSVQRNEISIEDAASALQQIQQIDIGHSVIDTGRKKRTGQAEVIYGEGKTAQQIVDIIKTLIIRKENILATRVSPAAWQQIKSEIPNAAYNDIGRTVTYNAKAITLKEKPYVAIVSAGTSDGYVVEEAYETVRALGYPAMKIVDVGVAGIHRLFNRLDDINSASVIIVVAGMEGALASVVGGLTEKPIIAVPTSVGYGANFGGISALLTMLNSCASGITVVNIDNGFGAAYCAIQILNLLD